MSDRPILAEIVSGTYFCGLCARVGVLTWLRERYYLLPLGQAEHVWECPTHGRTAPISHIREVPRG